LGTVFGDANAGKLPRGARGASHNRHCAWGDLDSVIDSVDEVAVLRCMRMATATFKSQYHSVRALVYPVGSAGVGFLCTSSPPGPANDASPARKVQQRPPTQSAKPFGLACAAVRSAGPGTWTGVLTCTSTSTGRRTRLASQHSVSIQFLRPRCHPRPASPLPPRSCPRLFGSSYGMNLPLSTLLPDMNINQASNKSRRSLRVPSFL
jgi:hypothetical protein